MDSLVVAALAGILVFVISGVISLRGTQDIFVKGVHLMGGIGIIMIAANGFAEVMKATGSVNSLVELVSSGIGDQRGLAVFLMLLIGLIITMGIGSSFSTVPLIAAIYVKNHIWVWAVCLYYHTHICQKHSYYKGQTARKTQRE